jgi:hypothetical protein
MSSNKPTTRPTTNIIMTRRWQNQLNKPFDDWNDNQVLN